MGTQKLKKNIEGFTDQYGIFHPIRNGEKEGGVRYSRQKSGDNDDVFDREIRKAKNEKKMEEIYQKREMEKALADALGEERKISLSQFVRRSGGIKYDPKSNDPYNGELANLSFKQSNVKGIAHKNGKYSLDGMRESADLSGYTTADGRPLATINDFLEVLESDLRGNYSYPFGSIGAYSYNPSSNPSQRSKIQLQQQIKNFERVIKKMKNRNYPASKIRKLEKAKETAKRLMQRPSISELKKNGILTAFAEAAVGTSAAVGLYDRFTKQKEVKGKNSNRDFVGLKDNKAKTSERQKAIYERSFQKLLVAIENGDLTKQTDAKRLGILAGNEANDVSRAIQYARLTYKLKQNPSAGTLKKAENLISTATAQLKQNGIVGRALGRYKAGKEYKRQLRLEAAIERAKKRRAAAEAKAKKNPEQNITIKEFKRWASEQGVQLIENADGFKVGDSVYFTNEYGGKFGIYKIVGIRANELSDGGRFYFNSSSWWFPAAKKSLTHAKKNRQTVQKNPIKSESFEAFQGRKPTKILELESPLDAPRNLYALGKLLELRLRGKQNLDFRRETTGKNFYLCADEKNKQLWIVGGKVASTDSSIKQGYSEPYALISHIVYETQKNHLDDTKPTGYIHKFGEDGGEEPMLSFDGNGFPIIVGGTYEITPLGIAD